MSSPRARFIDYFTERFGVEPSTWDPYEMEFKSRSVRLLGTPGSGIDWSIETRGFRVARPTSHSFKPTTRGIQWLGDLVTRSRVSVTVREMTGLLERETVVPDATGDVGRGFVAVWFDGIAVGCGFWTGDELETKISKAHGREFPRRVLSETNIG